MTIKPDPRYCTAGPDYKHDCPGCTYLGQCRGQPGISKHEDSNGNVDLWLCSGNERRLVRRFANAKDNERALVGMHEIVIGDDFNPRAEAEKIAASVAEFITEHMRRRGSREERKISETVWSLDELPNTPAWQEARTVLRAAGCKLNPTSSSHGDREDA